MTRPHGRPGGAHPALRAPGVSKMCAPRPTSASQPEAGYREGMLSEDLPLSRARVDRDGLRRVEEGLIEQLMTDACTRILHVIGDDVLTGADDSLILTAPAGTAAQVPTTPVDADGLLLYLGRENDEAFLAQIHPEAIEVQDLAGEMARRTDDPQGAPGLRRSHLRDLGWRLSARDAGLATQAVALANWHSSHRYCPRCGGGTEVIESGWVRRCVVDGSQHFPRTDPAVIMAIVDREERLLLGHAATWPKHRY